jgi:hypothetical protein
MPGKDQILGQKIEKGLHFLDYRVIYFIGAKSNFLLPYLTLLPYRARFSIRRILCRYFLYARKLLSELSHCVW